MAPRIIFLLAFLAIHTFTFGAAFVGPIISKSSRRGETTTSAQWKPLQVLAIKKGDTNPEPETTRNLLVDGSQQRRRAFLIQAAVAALPFVAGMAVPPKALADDGDGKATVHKVDYPIVGKCGQAAVPEKVVPIVKSFYGFQEGACQVDGYAVDQGTAKGTGDKDKERDYAIYGKW